MFWGIHVSLFGMDEQAGSSFRFCSVPGMHKQLLLSLFKNAKYSVDQFLFLFDHIVKPVLMYGAEVVGTFNSIRLCRSKGKTLKDMYVNSP